MILYFSGTGNSQYVAIRIAEMMEEEAVSINAYLKAGKKVIIRSSRPLVFVAPTYSWRMPKAVEQWIKETEFEGCHDAYFLLTCGDGCGNAARFAEKLCEKKGFQFCGLAPVVMPENYLALFPTPSESECRRIVEHADSRIAALAEQIQSGENVAGPPASLLGRLESGPVNPLFYALVVGDKGFSASEHCVSCGKCALRCALNNIELVNGKPLWKGYCTHCMACIGGCPVEAIEYKSKSKGRRRYYIMDDSLCWENGG